MKNTEEPNSKQIKNEYPELQLSTPIVEEPPIAYTGHRYSYADYLLWTDNILREIIDGMVYLFSAPKVKHALATGSLFGRAWSFVRRRKGACKVFTAPFDVRLPKYGETDNHKIYNVVQPDICVVCDLSKLDENGCIGAPDLIVEVSSPSTSKRDMNLKFNLYEESGVKEYWVVYPNDKAVTVFHLKPDGKYNDGKTYEMSSPKTKVPVKILKGLVIDLKELFEYE